jgi:predicted XRE-type DNA-binding protein
MTQQEKQKIVDLLQVYIKQKGSQNKAATSLKGVSSAVVSHLINGRWESYSDDMFRNIGNQIGYNSRHWKFVKKVMPFHYFVT